MKNFALCVLCVLCVYACSRSSAQRINLPPFREVKLDNGIRLVLMEYRRAPTLVVNAVFPGGDASDPAGKAGLSEVMSDLLTKGTEARTATQIAEQIDFLGGSLTTASGNENVTASLDVLSKDTDAGLDLFADVLRHSTFPEEELDRHRKLMIAGLQALADDPGAVASRVATETVFAGHPYGVSPTISSLGTIGRQEVIDLYQSRITPNRMIIVAVGDFKSAEMEQKLRARFRDWPRGSDTISQIPAAGKGARKLVLIDKPDATQTQVRLIRTAIPRVHPDYFAAKVAESILGGGFTSRLIEEIRVNKSLTYGIRSPFSLMAHGGSFEVSTFTKIETTRKLLDAVADVLNRTATRGFTIAELEKFKRYMSGLFAIRVQTPEALAAQLVEMAIYNLPKDYLTTYLQKVRAVTLADVNRIAKTYLANGGLSVVLVAPAKAVQQQLSGLGMFDIRPVTSVGK